MAEAYVGFAISNPALYRLMFSAELGSFEDRDLKRAADAAYASLAVTAAKVDPGGTGRGGDRAPGPSCTACRCCCSTTNCSALPLQRPVHCAAAGTPARP